MAFFLKAPAKIIQAPDKLSSEEIYKFLEGMDIEVVPLAKYTSLLFCEWEAEMPNAHATYWLKRYYPDGPIVYGNAIIMETENIEL